MSGITQISRDQGINVSIVRLTSADTVATCVAADYLTAQADNIKALNNGVWEWLASDLVAVSASDGHVICDLNAALDTLVPLPAGSGTVTLPVVSGDFTVFDGTLGGLKDLGYLPSDASKTNVVMESGASVIGNLPKYVDTAGTIGDSGLALANATLYVRVALTASQFNGMYGTPVSLVAAPGANKLIVVRKSYLEQTYVAAQFTAGGVVGLQYDSTVHGGGVPASGTLAAATVNGVSESTSYLLDGALTAAPLATTVNKGLYISNATQAFATGDSTFFVHVYYNVVSTT